MTVDSDFDPTKVAPEAAAAAPPAGVPPPAKKSDVIFEATAADIQELVLESPVPVLLDVYAVRFLCFFCLGIFNLYTH